MRRRHVGVITPLVGHAAIVPRYAEYAVADPGDAVRRALVQRLRGLYLGGRLVTGAFHGAMR